MIQTLDGALLINLALFAGLFAAQVAIRTRAHGINYSLSSLDANIVSTVLEDRLKRVTRNQLEFIALFGVTVVLAKQSITSIESESMIAMAAVLGRLLYVLMTTGGVPILRSASWLIAFAAWAYLAMQVFFGIA